MASLLVFALLATSISLTCAVDLLTALRASNASVFADMIAQDGNLHTVYLDPNVRTVFAPVDSAFLDFTTLELSGTQLSKEKPGDIYGTSDAQSDTSMAGTGKGFGTNNNHSANTETGQNSIIVVPKSAAVHIKRNQTLYDPRPQLEVISGLGDKVSVVRSFIEYDGGYLHTIDGHLTVPVRLSRTLATLQGTTAFGAIINSSNLTTSLDMQKGGTFFIPNNDAICALGNRTLSSEAIQGHVIKGHSAYLPLLQECTSFTSASGDVLRVTKSPDGSLNINNAKILSTNIILENGVAYIIDRVLTAPNNPPPFINAGPTTDWKSVKTVGGFALSVLLTTTLLV